LGVAPRTLRASSSNCGLLGADGEARWPDERCQRCPCARPDEHYEITRIRSRCWLSSPSVSGTRLSKSSPLQANGELEKYLWGGSAHLMAAFPNVKPAPAELIGLLRKLSPEYYSISSSPKAHPGRVHLTVAWCVTRPERAVTGFVPRFCRARAAGRAACGVHPTQSEFRPPAEGDRPRSW